MTTPILALRDHLERLRELLVTIPGDAYRVSPAKHSGTVGAHSRLRGTAVETDVRAALGEIKRLHLALSDLDAVCLDQPLTLRSMMRRGGDSVSVKTTLGRELAFVVQHTIHHCAIIGLLLDQVGVAVPRQFGYAPSTPVN
jgi:hypothetical protein